MSSALDSFCDVIRECLPLLLKGMSLCLLAVPIGMYVGGEVLFGGVMSGSDLATHLVISTPFIGGLFYGGLWLQSSTLNSRWRTRIGGWTGGGLLAFLGLNLIMMLPWGAESMALNVLWGVWAAGAGSGFGLAIGAFEAQRIEQELAAERDRVRRREAERRSSELESIAQMMSHDLRGPLSVAIGFLDLVQEEGKTEHLERVEAMLERMGEIVDETLTLVHSGITVEETCPVDLETAARQYWENIDTQDAQLEIENTLTFRAEETRLSHLFENLFANAVEHGGSTATVRVGTVDGGFYVEDDGAGIPPDVRDSIFEIGYSTTDGASGLGLAIVRQIVVAHGWTIEALPGTEGGARFEITGVEATEAASPHEDNVGRAPSSAEAGKADEEESRNPVESSVV